MTELSLTSGVVSGTDATDTAFIVNGTSGKVRVKAARLIPKTAVSTHASNYITTDVKKGSANLGSHTTNSSGGSALVAGTVTTIPITGSGTDLELDAGGVLLINVTKAGTGPAFNHQVVVTVEPIRG
jgi:hypothetical protein